MFSTAVGEMSKVTLEKKNTGEIITFFDKYNQKNSQWETKAKDKSETAEAWLEAESRDSGKVLS